MVICRAVDANGFGAVAAVACCAGLLAAAPARASSGIEDAERGARTSPTALASTDAYTYVPGELNLLHASQEELRQFGFPPRPSPNAAPEAYRAWKDAVIDMQRLPPVLQAVAIHHGPVRNTVAGVANGPATSSNWSGYVAPAPAFSFSDQSITNVFGDWILPVAQPAFNACRKQPDGAEVYSSTWVGIDGNGSGDVLQAGTESDAVCSQGLIGPYQAAWYEWYPYNEVRVTNLPVSPGAAFYVHVWASSPTSGHAYFANRSTHQSVSIRFHAPPGVKLIGNSAEWVVERPLVNGSLATLTNYVQVFFADAQAHDASGHVYYPGLSETIGQLPALQIQMTDDDNKVISVPTLLGQNAIWFTDQGSAKHLPTG